MTVITQRYALITGASSGIGKATALAFAKAGINLALVSRSEEKLAAVASAARQTGVEVKVYPLDLVQLDVVREEFRAIAADFGSIDILVNSAGIGYTVALSETPVADWLEVID